MNLKYLCLSFLFFSTVHAEWRGRAVLFSDDNGTWKVLLRKDPQDVWTDFNKSATQPGQRGNELAQEALRKQVKEQQYHLTKFSGWKKFHRKPQRADENDIVHFDVVPFIAGRNLYSQGKDFAWIPLDKLLTSQQITKPAYGGGEVVIKIDPQVKEILKQNKDTIYALLTLNCQNQPTQQQISTQSPIQGQSEWANIPGAIYFYDNTGPGSFYEFTNFYKQNVTINKKVWPTTEHYYQSMKFTFPYVQEKIRLLPGPRDAFNYARANSTEVRQDWKNVNLQFMLRAVRKKFKQNSVLKNLLLNTGNKILVEDAKGNDSFFGAGANYDGANHLGQILMHVRDELRGGPKYSYQPQPASYYLQKAQQPSITSQKIIKAQAPVQPLQPIKQQDPRAENELSELLHNLQQALEGLLTALNPDVAGEGLCFIQ